MTKALEKSKSEKLKEAERKHGFKRFDVFKNKRKKLRAGIDPRKRKAKGGHLLAHNDKGGGADMGRKPKKRGNPAVMDKLPKRKRYSSGGVAIKGRGCEIK
jgi:hypothetical protein|tara:strand:- start:231 stop:533 length:303 start_codon:yes stop_codon:yes gene_type:complete